jgi:hypothetical protein
MQAPHYIFFVALLQWKFMKMALLALSCLPSHLSACNELRNAEQIFLKFDNGNINKMCQHICVSVKTWQ